MMNDNIREGRIPSILPFSIKGGGKVGRNSWFALCASVPLAELSVTPEGIILVMPWRKFRFDRQNIQEIEYLKSLFGGGLRIRHTKAEYPAWISFGTLSSKELKELCAVLEEAGYKLV